MGLKRRFLVSSPISKFQLHNVKKTSISNEPRRLCMSQYLRMAPILSETTWFLFIERFLMLVLDIVPREFKNFKLRTDYEDFRNFDRNCLFDSPPRVTSILFLPQIICNLALFYHDWRKFWILHLSNASQNIFPCFQ